MWKVLYHYHFNGFTNTPVYGMVKKLEDIKEQYMYAVDENGKIHRSNERIKRIK